MINILNMTENHVSAVAALERENFSAPWSENSVRSELSNPISVWLVAEKEGELIGYVGSQSVLGEADMMNLAVDSRFRRQGVAYALVCGLVEALKEKDVYSLTLEVRASNEPAKALYGKMGFVQVGRRPNYYSAPKEDALILRKEWQL